MLVLSRKIGQRIFIGDDIVIEVRGVDRHRGKLRIGISAPPAVKIAREEVAPPGHPQAKPRPQPAA